MRQQGFTLTELLAVVLIVAILMGVGLPQYRKAVEKAHVAEVESMMRSIYDSSERLAGEFGYRSYAELVDYKGEEGYSFSRMDMFDSSNLPRNCSLADGGGASEPSYFSMNCRRFSYRALIKGNDNRYYVAARLGKGRHKGTYLMFDRDEQALYCQPKASETSDFCDMLGLDVRNAGFNF